MRIICGEDERFAKWASRQLNTSFQFCTVLGVENQAGEVAGAIVLNCYTGPDAELTFVGKGSLQRGICRAVAHYVFVQLKCERVSISVRATDKYTQKLALKFGFRAEGIKRSMFGAGQDAVLYGMLKDECRWLEV